MCIVSGLHNLEHLDLSHNDLSSTWILSNVFDHLHELRTLVLSHNRLSDLDEDIFKSFVNLEVLNLSSNQITKLSKHSFENLSNLRKLSLSDNHLTVIGKDSLGKAIFRIETLALDNNKITTVDNEAFANLTSLADLNMNVNNLESVPLAIKMLPSLKSLNLGENLISQLGENFLSGNSQLEALVLEQNKIWKITQQAFASSSTMRSVNMKRNRLARLEKEMFQPMIKLETFLLDHNYLDDINGVFSSLSSLKHLSISDNSLKWFDMAFFPKTIQAINMSRNIIEEIGNYYKMFDGFSLQSLDLSYNRISYLDQQMLVVSQLYNVILRILFLLLKLNLVEI
jgi:Leucine-rich repeat (LRR) protein